MNLKKKIIDLEKKVGTDDADEDVIERFFGKNIMGVLAGCLTYQEQHGCFPPETPEEVIKLLSQEDEILND